MESGAVDMIGDTVKLLLKCEGNGEVLSKKARPSIYMVPSLVRDLSPSSFTPTVVAIGPLHSKDEHLQEFEVQKTAYFHKLLHRFDMVREETMRNCVEKVIHSIEGIRACYAGLMTYTDSELAKMMVIDACFILEFIQSGTNISLSRPNIMITQSIGQDLFMIENQIPFFVLKIIFDCTIFASGRMRDSFTKYIKVLLSFHNFIEEHEVQPDALSPDPDHILGFLHKYFRPAKPMPSTFRSSIKCHTAIELDRAGVKFKPINENKNWVLDMKLELPLPLCSWFPNLMPITQFRGRTMRMPKLRIHDSSELILRNLVVYEDSSDVGTYVTSYLHALDMLIDTPEDVALLIKSEVLKSAFGSNEEAADMINKLCKNIDEIFFYGRQWGEMDVYYNSYWPNTIAELKRTYFNNPWNIIALIAAFVLFALTITQTITSIMAA